MDDAHLTWTSDPNEGGCLNTSKNKGGKGYRLTKPNKVTASFTALKGHVLKVTKTKVSAPGDECRPKHQWTTQSIST